MVAVIILVLFLGNTIYGKVDLYKGQSKSSFSCDVDISEPFSCICLHSGLWKVYASCLEYNYLAVKHKYCFSSREMIRRVEIVAQNTSKLPLVGENVSDSFSIVVNRPITVVGQFKSLCLTEDWSNVNGRYCRFEVNNLSIVTGMADGCPEDDARIAAQECFDVVDDEFTCPPSFPPRNSLNELVRKRRMLQPVAVVKNPVANNHDPDDEDFWDPSGAAEYGPDVKLEGANGKSVESPIIVSEIWDYLDQQLDEVLGLGDPGTPPASMQEIPVFQILDASKQVMLKTCPAYYVKPEFFDLAVDTFTAVLMKRNYLKELNNDFTGLNRILQTLSKCQANATSFPFIDESSHDECDKGHNKANPGAYEKYDNKSELVVHETMESYEYDAIIDIVWKIFVNSYQQCFAWFDPTNNDVFRYATIMESLFQGEIHDLWFNGKTQSNMYGGFLGNIKEITEYVTYCAASTALETAFPWSLERPAKITAAADYENRRRRKRSIPTDSAAGTLQSGAGCSAHKQCVDKVFF